MSANREPHNTSANQMASSSGASVGSGNKRPASDGRMTAVKSAARATITKTPSIPFKSTRREPLHSAPNPTNPAPQWSQSRVNPVYPSPTTFRRTVQQKAPSASAVGISIGIMRPTPTKDPRRRTDETRSTRHGGAIMSASSRAAAPKNYQDISTKDHSYTNDKVRTEYGFSGLKAARKSEELPYDYSTSSESSDSDSDSDSDSEDQSEADIPDSEDGNESDDSIKVLTARFPKRPTIIKSEEDPTLGVLTSDLAVHPPEELVATFKKLSLSVILKDIHRLPFLRRNLKQGFANYCHIHSIPTQSRPHHPVNVVFKRGSNEAPPHVVSMSSFECPLCELHPPFNTQEMLKTHLDRDHDDVHTTWEQESGVEIRWRLELLFSANLEENIPRGRAPSLRAQSPAEMSVDGDQNPASSQPRIPEPQPETNRFGPTAKYPFLPVKSEYGGPDLKYSTRFRGPKIYDLLGTLPMEEYGVLKWQILDREEEIFESDDIQDEHKVMSALWARWITLNRNVFIANYYEGTKLFVDRYWKLILQAAGWEALRFWLLMLMANRFLTGRHVAELLKRYEWHCNELEVPIS